MAPMKVGNANGGVEPAEASAPPLVSASVTGHRFGAAAAGEAQHNNESRVKMRTICVRADQSCNLTDTEQVKEASFKLCMLEPGDHVQIAMRDHFM